MPQKVELVYNFLAPTPLCKSECVFIRIHFYKASELLILGFEMKEHLDFMAHTILSCALVKLRIAKPASRAGTWPISAPG